MGFVPFLFVNGFLLAVAGIFIAAAIHGRRRAALLKATPTSNIGMAQDGYCEFEGTVEAIAGGPPIIAPLTQTPCAWYRAKLEKWERRGGNQKSSYTTIQESTSYAPIMLRDATGVCQVFTYGAEVTATDRSQWTGPTAVPADRNPPRLGPSDSLSQGFTVSGTANTKYRYFEERIYHGDPLLVLGEFSRRQFDADLEDDDDDDDDEEDVNGEELDESDLTDADESEATSDEADGDRVDLSAWEDSGRDDQLTTLAGRTTRACIQQGSGSKPFIVTTTPQATHVYVTEVGGQAALYMALGPIGLVALLLYARYG